MRRRWFVSLGIVKGDVSDKLSGETLTDALFQLLVCLNNRTMQPDLLLNAIVSYLTPATPWNPTQLSEAVLLYLTKVLDCTLMANKFASLNGMELLWQNFVSSVSMLGGGKTGLVSSVMNQLAPPLPPTTAVTAINKRVEDVNASDTTNKSLYNFAPLATISSSNPTARPADALVRTNHYFPRTKGPPWSYHFYPDENSVDLNLTLPCPILLHEVHLLPHSVSLGIVCPSRVSIETGLEGGALTPTTGLVSTAGLACVKIALSHPVVASVVVVRLYKPCDQSTLGLSHLKLLGTTTFSHSHNLSTEQSNNESKSYKASYWWLRLISHCINISEEACHLVSRVGVTVPSVIESCVTLLLMPSSALPNSTPSSSFQQNHFITRQSSSHLENTIVSLLAEEPHLDRLYLLISCLFNHPLLMQPSANIDSAVGLIYSVSLNLPGINLLLKWLSKLVEHRATNADLEESINSEVLHCLASVLWNYQGDISATISSVLFKNIFEWSKTCAKDLKLSLDYILGSMCKCNSDLFTQLLKYMGILSLVTSESLSLTDDRKDQEAEIQLSRTDDMKEGLEVSEERLLLQDPSNIRLCSKDLQTLAIVAQSVPAMHLMLDSGFPLLLVHGILEWCKAELVNQAQQAESCTTTIPNFEESITDLEKASSKDSFQRVTGENLLHSGNSLSSASNFTTEIVVQTLEMFTALSSEPIMKDWLGSGEGSVFWIPLLTVLGDPVMCDGELSLKNGSFNSKTCRVEDATIAVMKVCCQNHPVNQKALAGTLCHLIQRQNTPPPGGLTYMHSLSGFTRRLILQILLEPEKVFVHIDSKYRLSAPPAATLPPQSRHPKYGTGTKSKLLYLPVTTKIEEVISLVTDWYQGSVGNPHSLGENNAHNDMDDGSAKKELGEVGLELVDKLSVAAGVTAKDKRNKDKSNNSLKRSSRESKKSSSSLPSPSAQKSSISSSMGLIHKSLLGGLHCLPASMTLGQVMASLVEKSEVANAYSELSFEICRKTNETGNLMIFIFCYLFALHFIYIQLKLWMFLICFALRFDSSEG